MQKGKNMGIMTTLKKTYPRKGGECGPLGGAQLPDVLDLWAERGRRTARGAVIIVRYGGDCIVGCAHRDAAERFWAALRARFQQVNLALPPEKTRRIECGH
jgi:hypothetical protein